VLQWASSLPSTTGKEFVVMVNADTEVVNKNFVAELAEAALRLLTPAHRPQGILPQKGRNPGTSLYKPTLFRHLFAFL
jgi:GT2 family glycosyltransferase